MSTEAEKNSHAAAWIIALLLLLPVLYGLSAGPLFYLDVKLHQDFFT